MLIEKLGLDVDLDDQMNSNLWPQMKKLFAQTFATKTMADWSQVFNNTEACCSPILTFDEAAEETHNVEREAFLDADGIIVPSSAPLFSRSGNPKYTDRPMVGEHTKSILRDFDFSNDEIESLLKSGAVSAT